MTSPIGDAIAAVAETSIVTKWYVVAETIDPSGEVALVTLESEGMSQWDALGMLRYGARSIETDID